MNARGAAARVRSGGLETSRGLLARAPVDLDLKTNLLPLHQAAHAGALKRRRMHKHILAASIRLDETIALLLIVP